MAIPVDIPWSSPLFEPTKVPADAAAKCKRSLGSVPKMFEYLSELPWLIEFIVDVITFFPPELDRRWGDAIPLIAAQENACRYCYGSSRAYLRLQGWSERRISKVEQLIDLDNEPTLAAVARFIRTLARSNPRPAEPERQALLDIGLSTVQVNLLAYMTAQACAMNRITTFVAIPPETRLESFAHSWLSAPLRPLIRFMAERGTKPPDHSNEPPWDGPFAPLTHVVHERASSVLSHCLRNCFEHGRLSRTTKLLVFAIVARAMTCAVCCDEAVRCLVDDGMSLDDVERSLSSLDCSAIPEDERPVLAWARETVWYVPLEVQQRTQQLVERIGPAAALDAIGTASFANGTVRLAMLGA